jgi:hypothetical protein
MLNISTAISPAGVAVLDSSELEQRAFRAFLYTAFQATGNGNLLAETTAKEGPERVAQISDIVAELTKRIENKGIIAVESRTAKDGHAYRVPTDVCRSFMYAHFLDELRKAATAADIAKIKALLLLA